MLISCWCCAVLWPPSPLPLVVESPPPLAPLSLLLLLLLLPPPLVVADVGARFLLALLAACTISRGLGKPREGSTNSLPIQLVPCRVEKSDAECLAFRLP